MDGQGMRRRRQLSNGLRNCSKDPWIAIDIIAHGVFQFLTLCEGYNSSHALSWLGKRIIAFLHSDYVSKHPQRGLLHRTQFKRHVQILTKIIGSFTTATIFPLYHRCVIIGIYVSYQSGAHDQLDLSDSTLTIFHKSFILFIWVYEYEQNISAFGCGAAGVVSSYDVVRSTGCKMIENIPTLLVSVAGSGIAGFFSVVMTTYARLYQIIQDEKGITFRKNGGT